MCIRDRDEDDELELLDEDDELELLDEGDELELLDEDDELELLDEDDELELLDDDDISWKVKDLLKTTKFSTNSKGFNALHSDKNVDFWDNNKSLAGLMLNWKEKKNLFRGAQMSRTIR